MTPLLRAMGIGLLLYVGTYSPAYSAEALKIAVVGGNGFIGQRIVREALKRGHDVTAIARDPSRVEMKHERLVVRGGDVLNRPQMSTLVAGHDVVVSTVGSARDASPDPAIYLEAAESLVEVLRGLGKSAPRLIVVGGAGSLKNSAGVVLLDRLPPERKGESLGQKAALDYYRTISDVNWTYFSPAGSMTLDDAGKGRSFRLGEDEVVVDEKGQSSISMDDYAVALIDEAEHPKHTRRRFTIGY
jgi:hypothetical protein